MRLSPHFEPSEFACKGGCGFGMEPGDVSPILVCILEVIRYHFDAEVYVNEYGGSGCRCRVHNAKIGGSVNSQHLYGRAADIKVKGVSPDEVADFCETLLARGGLGRYNTFTHIDVRGEKARWDYRTKEK